MAESEKDGRTPGQRLLWTPTAGQDETKSYFPLSQGQSVEARVRDVVARHHSIEFSELVKLAGVQEHDARAVLDQMYKQHEGYWSRDIIQNKELFNAYPLNMGKTIIERRLREKAGHLRVSLDDVRWNTAQEVAEPAFTFTVTSGGQRREAQFTETELEEVAEGEENKNIVDSRLFNLLKPGSVRRLG